ncbi:MAG: PilZ domain-containing protein [Planctomycetota bacterium]
MNREPNETQISLADGAERRRFPRQLATKPCRIRFENLPSLDRGETRDVSSGGALIRVGGDRPLRVGDEIDVVIVWRDDALVPLASMTPALVRRVSRDDEERQLVGVEFRVPQRVQRSLDRAA